MSVDEAVSRILPLIGRQTDRVELIKRGNDVFRLTSETDHFVLKTYTKDWYGPDPATTGFHAAHERVAWAILARQGLPVPVVVYVGSNSDNPISRPFIPTRQLEGQPLTKWLVQVNPKQRFDLMAVIGDYLRRIYPITFKFPAHLSDLAGPAGPPDPDSWQHRCWSAGTREAEARH